MVKWDFTFYSATHGVKETFEGPDGKKYVVPTHSAIFTCMNQTGHLALVTYADTKSIYSRQKDIEWLRD